MNGSFRKLLLSLLFTGAAAGYAPAATVTPVEGNSHFSGTHTAVVRNMNDGMPGNFVDDIFMDDAGLAWISTSGGGLSRYDGYTFITFSSNSEPHIKSNFVRVVAQDGFRRLWVATEGGIDVLNLETLAKCDFPELAPFEFEFCSHLISDAAGAIWVKSGTCIRRISFNRDGSIERVSEYTDSRLSAVNYIFSDVERDGSIWVCLGGDFYKMTASQDGSISLSLLFKDLTIREDAYVSAYLLKDNEIWIATADGLYRRSMTGGPWRHYTHSPDDDRSLSQNFITDIAITPEKELLFSTLKGINIYNPLEDDFERVAVSGISPGDRSNTSEFINCVRVYGNQIWLGTETAGLVQMYSRRLSLKNFTNIPGRQSSLPPSPVNAVFEDEEGRFWVGNVEYGLSVTASEAVSDKNAADTDWKHLTAGNAGLSHNSVSAICSDSEGRMWIGTWGGGLNLIVPGRQPGHPEVLADIFPPHDSADSLSYIGSLAFDSINGLMWIGTNSGIFYYDIDSGKVCPALKDQTWGCVGICADSKGRLWMGCQNGLYMFDLKRRLPSAGGNYAFPYRNFRFKMDDPESHIIEKISCITEGSDGTLWFGSMSNGIYSAKEGGDGKLEFVNFSSVDGLASDIVKGILEDGSGNLWISTVNGLSEFSPADGSFVNYSVMDGLQSPQFYWNAALKTKSGLLCFGHVEGMTVVDPEYVAGESMPASLRIISVTVDGNTDMNPYAEKLRFHERNRTIELEFSALTFDSDASGGFGDHVKYSYMMEGIDKTWIPLPHNRHFLRYTSMRQGKYRLNIRAIGPDGVEIARTSVPVRVVPYFYNTWWFYIVVLVCLVSLVLLVFRIRLRNLERQRQELRDTVEERTREISRQNRILTRQIEELAGHQVLRSSENREAQDNPDELFVTKALSVVREHYKDTSLDVTSFCSAMGMSKTYLNFRMQETLGQSIGQFIRTYRLSIAREMLINNREDRKFNISEIAYECGFNDPKYFTRCFTKEFGTSPAVFQKGCEQ